jgi:hypothetical protein
MSGYVIPIAEKRFFDFTTLAAPNTQTIVLADRVDVMRWRELTLCVRVHDHSLAGGAGAIFVRASPQSFSREEPGTIFVDTTSIAAEIAIDSTTTQPALLLAPINVTGTTNCMSDLAYIHVSGTRSAAGPITATISVEISAKDA